MNDDDPIVIEDECDNLLAPTKPFQMWQDWAQKCASRYQPKATMLSAAITMGCLMGRQIVTTTGLRGNLYGMILLPTSQGKEALKQMGSIIAEKCGRNVGAAKMGSDAGMIKELQNNPETIWFLDEFSSAIAAWKKPNCETYLLNLKTMMLEMYSGNTWRGKSLKDVEEIPTITLPHPCITAFIQPSEFERHSTQELVACGLYGRFLFTCRDEHVQLNQDAIAVDACIPQDLVEYLKELTTRNRGSLSAYTSSARHQTVFRPDPDHVDAIRELASKVDQDHSAKFSNDIEYSLRGRMWENMSRLALVHAWSGGGTTLTLDGYKWGKAVVEDSIRTVTNRMVYSGIRTEHEAGRNNVLKCVMRTYQRRDVTVGLLLHDIRSLDPDRLDKVLNTMLISGELVKGRSSRGNISYRPSEDTIRKYTLAHSPGDDQ